MIRATVLTSNEYLGCLPPFAYFFNLFWPGMEATVVRYDKRLPALPGNFSQFAIGQQCNYTWSQGLRYYLQHCEQDIILLLLEDYFLSSPVDNLAVEAAVVLMESNRNVGKVDLSGDRCRFAHVDYPSYKAGYKYPLVKLVASATNSPYAASLQAALWRKSLLLTLLEDHENPWQFEKRGTKRLHAMVANEIPVTILGLQQPPLAYINAKGGEGTAPQVWQTQRMPGWMRNDMQSKGWL